MIGSLAELAAMPGMPSEPTLRKWITAEPDQDWILKRGRNGDAYELDLEGAFKAYRAREDLIADEAKARSSAVQQLGFELLGKDAAAINGEQTALTAKDRVALLEEELVAIKVAEKRRELVRKASVEAALAEFLVWLRQRQATFSARLKKRADFSREQLLAVDRLIEADQAEIAARMEAMKDAGDEDGDPPV